IYNGTITTSGEFFKVTFPEGNDGYSINEVTDFITSRTTQIDFSAVINCRDEGDHSELGSIDGGLFTTTDFICVIDGVTFTNMTFVDTVDGGLFTDTEFVPFTSDDIEYSTDGITFGSGDIHYIFDMAYRKDANRVSLYRDGTGYLNFEVFDNQAL